MLCCVLRSCGTLQQALELLNTQCPRKESPKEMDTVSEATTLVSLSRIFGHFHRSKTELPVKFGEHHKVSPILRCLCAQKCHCKNSWGRSWLNWEILGFCCLKTNLKPFPFIKICVYIYICVSYHLQHIAHT